MPYQRTPASKRPPKRQNGKSFAVLLGGIAVCLLLCLAVSLAIPQNQGPPTPPYTIALDAGHGGKDLGAMGIVPEVELTERTVAFLYTLLEADENYTPILCREYGKNADVNQRAKTARRKGAELLLSVHANAHTSADTQGFECYPAPPGRDYHEESLRFAQLLAAEMAAAGSPLRGEGGVRYVYYENGSDKVFREASDVTVYEEKSFAVVEQPNCPAVLVEQCFVTSAASYEAFGNEAGCQIAAQRYYNAICAFFGTTPVTPVA